MRGAIVDWKIIGKAIIAGLVVFGATEFAEFDPLEIEDWSFWAIYIGGGLVRSIGAAIIAVVWVVKTTPAEGPTPPPTP